MKYPKHPTRIVLETSTQCNLNCIMCGREKGGINMSLDVVDRIKPYFLHAKDVSLFSWGEATMNPNLEDIVSVIPENCDIFLLTNGMKKLNPYLISRLKYLNFSIDSIDKKTLSNIRQGADLETILENIKDAIQYKHPNLHTRAVMVAMKSNYREMPRWVVRMKQLGFDEVKIIHMIAFSPEIWHESMWHQKEEFNDYLRLARQMSKKVDILYNFPEEFDSGITKQNSEHKLCLRPFEEVLIRPNGDVKYCRISNHIIGNIFENTLEEIWNSNELNKVRAIINTSNPPNSCNGCGEYSSIDVNNKNSFYKVRK